MYTLFIQKEQGDKTPFPLMNYLHDFLKVTNAEGIIIAPGSLSYGTSNVNELLDSLLFGSGIKSFGILNRYGRNTIPQYEAYLSSKSILLDIDRNGKSDHSKIVFIFNYKKGVFRKRIDSLNYLSFLNDIEVIGVAIGSSNFSLKTYGNKSNLMTKYPTYNADKGEGDIFMFFNDEFKTNILNQINNGIQTSKIVLSQSLHTVSNEFLKEILNKEFEISL